MPDELDVTELDLSDAQLIELLKNHGLDRRTLMKVLGVGAGVSALGGTAAGTPGRGNRIDEVYGASYAAGRDTVPSGLVDHTVGLHIHEEEDAHSDFPMVDSPEDGDFKPDTEGPETFFDPVGLNVRPGGVVEFTVHGSGLHTVTAFDPKFNEPPFLVLPDRVPTDYAFTSPPVAEDDSWLYRFTEKGVYDLFCLPHVSLGMVMRIVVSSEDPTPEKPQPDPEAPLPPNADAVLTDAALDPSNIVAEGEVAWGDLDL